MQHAKPNRLSEKGTIAMSLVNETLALPRVSALDMTPILESAGIARAALATPRARVSAAQYGALWSAIARALDDEFFGQDSHAMKTGSFVAMTHASLGARTGRRALQRAVGNPAEGYCRACFTGDYPIPVPDSSIKLRFEPGVREPLRA